jgi:hypothetical protein
MKQQPGRETGGTNTASALQNIQRQRQETLEWISSTALSTVRHAWRKSSLRGDALVVRGVSLS